ncbi:MAG: adenosyl-hopene transferase HpnH [Rhodospirillaceae bacterium]|nr:adenosyl-hopene transferase HpnH [Rhodospirillaceae bacterium]
MGVPLIQQVRVGAYLIKQRIKGNKRFPLVLMLEPLFRCNLACAGCGKIDYPDHILNKRLTVQECIDAVEECGAPMVAIPGGEPLLHKEIGEIVRELIKRKKFISLCTNALILEKKLDLFEPSPYLTFTVHLDGDREHHDKMVCMEGGYDIAVAAIKTAKAKGFRVNINATLFDGIDVPRMADFFDFVTKELKVDGINASPGYAYERAADQEHFLTRQKTKQLFRDIFRRGKGKKWNFNQSSLFLDFLAGNQEYHCTPWSMPTRNPFGWQRPCYLVGEGYTKSFHELMATTDWDSYGTGKYEKCANCMVHCGYEGTAVEDTFSHPLKALKVFLRGPKTEGPMAPELNLAAARPAERLHERHVYDAMKDVPLTNRDKRWFESKNLPVPERANESKAPTVAAE